MANQQDQKDYNLEHMPNFIKDAPWYLSKEAEEPELFHQRIEKPEAKGGFENWYKRGQIRGAQSAKTFRKGACTNCGAITHKAKECTERPRKVGAKYTSASIQKDEYNPNAQGVKLNFESKRDRWNGYNPDDYRKDVIKKWELRQQLAEEHAAPEKKRVKKERAKRTDDVYSSDSDSEPEETTAKDDSEFKNPGLRIREDTAKYLRNLDPNSARYDPKSRTLKDNPNPDLPEEEQTFKGDNFVKLSGDYLGLLKNEGAMVELNKQTGPAANTVAMPSQFELLQREAARKQERIRLETRAALARRYGGEGECSGMAQEIDAQVDEEADERQTDLLEKQLELQRKIQEGKARVLSNLRDEADDLKQSADYEFPLEEAIARPREVRGYLLLPESA